ncbi:MAG: asparagine synthase (glutamine-hydrolyzing) [Candidatus Marinimicrobia bacterium]|nr:asparagine synthase (glutamine-hydrolyzing) [Candidatus Neomarinimicrobiota bacterium]
MCAINGFNSNDEKMILKMNRSTSHRGPDGTGHFCDENISLGHNRLSIIDLSDEANQPMESFDGKQTIVFNGEIYNFQELKKEISEYSFQTKSDTEVILAVYKKWGYDCVKKFNGIFAFAIWDKEKKELFLARDHVGVKPLYYFNQGGEFIFSSEIKAILEHDIPRVLNREAFSHYFRVLYTPEPLTMFKDIFKLPPASFAVLKNGDFKITKYWNVGENSEISSSASLEEELRNNILKSIERQLVSDKPLGVYLSGGIDSSIVLHNMAQLRDKIDTFSVGFELTEEEQKDKFNADFHLAKKTAEHYGTNHNEVLVSPDDVLKNFEKAIWHLDEPISNPTIIPMMKLAGFAKNKVDVVLGGDGGDELFGGYDRYRLDRMARFFMPQFNRFTKFMFQKDNILEKTLNDFDKKTTERFFKEKYFVNKKLLMDVDRQSWLVDFSLAMTDKMTMSAGLEERVPFLDKDLVEFAFQIPVKKKVNFFDTKIILKDAYRGKIPEFLFNQPKRGWFSPGAKWIRRPEVNSWVKYVLSENYYKETSSIFNWNNVFEIFDDHCTGKKYNLTIIWAILTFQVWAKIYKIKI